MEHNSNNEAGERTQYDEAECIASKHQVLFNIRNKKTYSFTVQVQQNMPWQIIIAAVTNQRIKDLVEVSVFDRQVNQR